MFPESIKYTSFVLPYGQYGYTKLCFGLKNSLRAFQRVINNLLGHLSYVKIYMYDILIASKYYKCHAEHIKSVLEILSSVGASINFPKSKFYQEVK